MHRYDGVMAATGLFKNPTLFQREVAKSRVEITLEYLTFAEKYRANMRYTKPHRLFMLQSTYPGIAQQIKHRRSIKELQCLLAQLTNSPTAAPIPQNNDFQSLFDM